MNTQATGITTRCRLFAAGFPHDLAQSKDALEAVRADVTDAAAELISG